MRLTFCQGGRQGETTVERVVRVTTDGPRLEYVYRVGTDLMTRGLDLLSVPVRIEEDE